MKIYDFHGKNNISGNKIRQARALRKVTQADLAAKLQIEGVQLERNSISKIESGDRFVADYELLAISKVLKVSVEWLLNDEL
jgi:transcriptional regulator with XRE-family HTH domain